MPRQPINPTDFMLYLLQGLYWHLPAGSDSRLFCNDKVAEGATRGR